MEVLFLFQTHADHFSIADVAKKTGYSRPTARRILITLQSLGLLHKTGRRYHPSSRLLSHSVAYRNQFLITYKIAGKLKDIALKLNGTVSLSQLYDDQIHFLCVKTPPTVNDFEQQLKPHKAKLSAMGQLLLGTTDSNNLYIHGTHGFGQEMTTISVLVNSKTIDLHSCLSLSQRPEIISDQHFEEKCSILQNYAQKIIN